MLYLIVDSTLLRKNVHCYGWIKIESHKDLNCYLILDIIPLMDFLMLGIVNHPSTVISLA